MMNLLEPGDSAVVVRRSAISGSGSPRWRAAPARTFASIEVAQGEIIDPARDRCARSKERPAKLVAFVHVETTTGACQPIAPMVDVARKHGALVAMDCVTSLGGLPIDIDALGVDAAGSCSQKCIGAPPGLAPITVGPRAMEAVRARKHKPHDVVFRSRVALSVLGRDGRARTRAFHHTAPIAAIYGFHEALRLILEEGLEARWARHQAAHEVLVRGLDGIGLSLFPPAANRCATINVIKVPRGHRRSEGAASPARHGRRDGRRTRRARRQGVARGRDGLQRPDSARRAIPERTRRRAQGRRLERLRIALANIRPGSTPDEALRLARQAIVDAGRKQVDVICFPECYVPGYRTAGRALPPPNADFLEGAWSDVSAAARSANVAVVLGTERVVDGAPRLTALVIDRDGSIAGFQDKVQLDPSEESIYSPALSGTSFASAS